MTVRISAIADLGNIYCKPQQTRNVSGSIEGAAYLPSESCVRHYAVVTESLGIWFKYPDQPLTRTFKYTRTVRISHIIEQEG